MLPENLSKGEDLIQARSSVESFASEGDASTGAPSDEFIDDLAASTALKRFLITRGVTIPEATINCLARLETEYAEALTAFNKKFEVRYERPR